jgi:ER membrane protein complex subunit 3
MEGTMEMMKKNMVMFIPQTLIMSWISFFFSGFVLSKLPFPLTVYPVNTGPIQEHDAARR